MQIYSYVLTIQVALIKKKINFPYTVYQEIQNRAVEKSCMKTSKYSI